MTDICNKINDVPDDLKFYISKFIPVYKCKICNRENIIYKYQLMNTIYYCELCTVLKTYAKITKLFIVLIYLFFLNLYIKFLIVVNIFNIVFMIYIYIIILSNIDCLFY